MSTRISNRHVSTFNGISARIILHEYDHIEGKIIHRLPEAAKEKIVERQAG